MVMLPGPGHDRSQVLASLVCRAAGIGTAAFGSLLDLRSRLGLVTAANSLHIYPKTVRNLEVTASSEFR